MKIKLTDEAKRIQKLTGINFIPERASPMSAGLNLKACIQNRVEIPPDTCYQIPTGIHIWLETPNFAGMIYPRSSCKKFVLMNTIGVVDGDYQGEILLNIRNVSDDMFIVCPGDRIAQFVITKICSDKLELVEEFGYETSRGKVVLDQLELKMKNNTVQPEMEYVYIPKEPATKIKNWASVEDMSKELHSYLNKSKSDLTEGNLQDINFDINKFKEQLVEARAKLTEVIEAELTETTKVWDYYFAQMKSLRTLADEALVVSKEVKTSVQALNVECCSLNTHALKELVEMIEKLSRISEENKEVLKFVVKNYEA